MPPVGQMFADRYELGPEIGRGGMAEVFLARDRLLEREVAVKVLAHGYASEPTFVARFRREAQAAASLNHENIVAVYDWGEDGDDYFIVMEYIAGRTLREVLRTYHRLPAMEAARIAAEIADALSFAHRNGVVHRDVKPGNVLLTAAGHVKVTDFGIARADEHDDLTKPGAVMGTATYFSPEQAQGLELDGRADVYALGVVLYEMLTGAAPFVADNPVSVAYKHVRELPVPPSHVNPDVPGALDRIVLTALEKDPALRYQSANELRADLMRFERGRPLVLGPRPEKASTHSSGTPTVLTPAPAMVASPAPARTRRGYGSMITVGVAFALLLTLIGVLLVQSNFGEQTAAAPTSDVPLVLGRTFSEAEATLKGEGFKVLRIDDTDSDQAPDLVLRQIPEAGSRFKTGGTVRLTTSSNTITVPSVVGKTREEATAALTAKRLAGSYVEVDSTEKPGTVLSTAPAAGEKVPKPAPGSPNTVITVNIAREPPVPIPDVNGQDADPAIAALKQAGFATVERVDVFNDDVPIGKVIATDPPAGTPTSKTQPIRLLVSKGSNEIEVPSVIGKTRDEAAAELLALRLNVEIVLTPSTPSNSGRVLSQQPAAGTMVRPLDKVTITVGS